MDTPPFKTKQIIAVVTIPAAPQDASTSPRVIAGAIKAVIPQAKYVQVWGNITQFLTDLAPPELIHGEQDSIEEDDEDPHAIHQRPTRILQ